MDIVSIVIFIVIGAAAGWLAGLIFRGKKHGFIGNAIIGIIGSFIGGWLLPLLGFSFGGAIGGFIAAVVGALILLFLISLIRK